MSIREIFETGAGRFHETKDYERNGIEIIKNTPEEIKDTVDEMEKRLNGTWKENEEDKDLQKSFWSHFKSSGLHGVIRARIGAKFLRESKDLL